MIEEERKRPRKVETRRYSGVCRRGKYRRCSSSVMTAMKKRHSAKNTAELIILHRWLPGQRSTATFGVGVFAGRGGWR
jgi:hypothetical protein